MAEFEVDARRPRPLAYQLLAWFRWRPDQTVLVIVNGINQVSSTPAAKVG
jgi:hypothetical protein